MLLYKLDLILPNTKKFIGVKSGLHAGQFMSSCLDINFLGTTSNKLEERDAAPFC